MSVTIALVGNPNSGKTTLFNALTGSNQFVGNWPGVTVEKKEGQLKNRRDVIVTDLPGIYSMSPYTLEEVIARSYLIDERPSAVLNIVDGTNLERNLFLTLQLMEIGIPVVVAINMLDVLKKNGDDVNTKKLSEELGCPVVSISALTGEGITEAAEAAISASAVVVVTPPHKFSAAVEVSLAKIEKAVLSRSNKNERRFFALKLFERDEKIIERLELTNEQRDSIEKIIKICEQTLEDDSVSIIITERYAYIDSIIKDCMNIKNRERLSASDKIDAIVTNRFLALPIFAAIMFVVYYVSITTVGTWATDWTNDVLFGQIVPQTIGAALAAVDCAAWLQSLILDGIIAGVGSVLGFVPQMMVLFACLAFLEACGYMARIAFILDRVFRRFGLSGKSFIPILIGTGCGVPGIMAARTIENDVDRKMTVITTTFIPCGAKLPMIALIAGAMFGGAGWVAASAYFVGIAAILCSGLMLKKTKYFVSDAAAFVMELPDYRLPMPVNILRSMWERSWSFIKKAGTIILLSTVIIWFVSNVGWVDGHFTMVEMNDSLLSVIGGVIAPIFAPLGWGDWRAAVAVLTGLVAKENVVGTLAVLFGFSDGANAQGFGTFGDSFTRLSAYSFLIFNLLCAPCFAAMGAIKKEMNSWRWFFIAVGYQCALAYVVSFCIYQFGGLIWVH